jgi:hypothetical protein
MYAEGEEMSEQKCSRCGLPITRDDYTEHLGDRVAHQYSRCVKLLLAENEALLELLANGIDMGEYTWIPTELITKVIGKDLK